ncbi:MAG: aminopeptidase P N-terminal domain-containing protein [Bacteroidales bacterium]|nr:aminopeptidase P N-terminal domain-containing protein [Bacteroidales bacterium]
MRKYSFDSSFFKGNRQRLLMDLEENAVAIIHSNDEMYRSGDQNYRYRQNTNLFYMTGINQEKTILVFVPNHPDKKLREILFIRKSNKKLEIWEGHKLTMQEARDISGITTVKWDDEFDSFLREQLVRCDTIYYDVPEYPKYKPDIPFRSQRLLKEMREDYPLHHFKRLFPVIARQRQIKQPLETDAIKKACQITAGGFLRILKYIKPGIYEYQIEAELTHEFIMNGAEGHAYPPIIASGENACILHYTTNNEVCKDGDLLLMDFGAEYANYSSDLSRTIPVKGKFSKRQRELYDATLRVFRFANGIMKPGTTINKIHKEVCRKWEEEHIHLGLYTKQDVKSNKKDEPLWSKYFMHGTSHFMGLDVHDTGSKDEELKPGMVLTCEPGIYIPEEKTGVRLENDIMITEKGNFDLMNEIPIEAEEIEEIMNK